MEKEGDCRNQVTMSIRDKIADRYLQLAKDVESEKETDNYTRYIYINKARIQYKKFLDDIKVLLNDHLEKSKEDIRPYARHYLKTVRRYLGIMKDKEAETAYDYVCRYKSFIFDKDNLAGKKKMEYADVVRYLQLK